MTDLPDLDDPGPPLRDSIDLTPRTRGRPPLRLEAEVKRDLTEADLSLLGAPRGVKAPSIGKIRDRHHSLARCIAQGMKDHEASAITGYSPSRISILKSDPLFNALVEGYRDLSADAYADFVDRATTLALTAVNELQDRMEDDATAAEMTPATLLEIGKFGADRAGYAPVNKTVNVGVNVNIGQRLQAARARLSVVPPAPAEIPTLNEAEEAVIDEE